MTPQAETLVIDRLERWMKVLGSPMYGGRSNPDNDMYFMLLDAKDCIEGLRLYARKTERALKRKTE